MVNSVEGPKAQTFQDQLCSFLMHQKMSSHLDGDNDMGHVHLDSCTESKDTQNDPQKGINLWEYMLSMHS